MTYTHNDNWRIIDFNHILIFFYMTCGPVRKKILLKGVLKLQNGEEDGE
tara:strand:+ start:123 stop:269 length:147 start_codon:yes stop_codon:yes gene_type:complete